MTDTANLGLPLIEASQAQKHVTHNEALRILDATIQIGVLDVTRTAPPVSPSGGDRHVIAASPTGAWSGQAKAIATWEQNSWRFLAPRTGWCVWSAADEVVFVFDGAIWRDQRDLPVSLDNTAHVGINTTAAGPNLLSVKSNAALFAAIDVAGGGTGDVRVQLSKESAAKTASVVFANAYSGRAEFGLVGSDAFKLKISGDGATWVDALAIDQSSGTLALPRGVALNGAISPPQITSNQNDYAPTGYATATALRLHSDASRTVSGLAGGFDGLIRVIVNVGSFSIMLSDADAASSALNRFAFGGNLTLATGQIALLWYDTGVGRWKLIAASTIVDGSLPPAKLDAASASKQKDFRAAIHAAPFDAMAFSGMQINGAMEVSQENAASAVTLTGTGSLQTKYIVDGMMAAWRGTFVATAQQVTDAPPGFNTSIKFTVTTAQSSLGANDELSALIPIEGVRVSRLALGNAAAASLSFGFWIKAHRTGSYSAALMNAPKTRSHPFSFAVGVADVWEYKTVTVAGDTSGTWLKDAGVGLYLNVCIAGGTSRLGTAGAWVTTTSPGTSGATGSTNGVAATSDTFQITGLIVVPGIELPSSDRSALILRPYDQELAACLRYFSKLGFSPETAPADGATSFELVGACYAANTVRTSFRYSAPMRATPVIVFYRGVSIGTAGKWGVYDAGWTAATTMSLVGQTSMETTVDLAGATATGGRAVMVEGGAKMDARL